MWRSRLHLMVEFFISHVILPGPFLDYNLAAMCEVGCFGSVPVAVNDLACHCGEPWQVELRNACLCPSSLAFLAYVIVGGKPAERTRDAALLERHLPRCGGTRGDLSSVLRNQEATGLYMG